MGKKYKKHAAPSVSKKVLPPADEEVHTPDPVAASLQKCRYEGIPNLCSFCGLVGHEAGKCPSKPRFASIAHSAPIPVIPPCTIPTKPCKTGEVIEPVIGLASLANPEDCSSGDGPPIYSQDPNILQPSYSFKNPWSCVPPRQKFQPNTSQKRGQHDENLDNTVLIATFGEETKNSQIFSGEK